VNQQRHNALNSFETFADAASDEATRNAVLVQAMQAIYSQQPSGYSSVTIDQPGVAQIVEVVKAAATTKG
jgi:hypothetical protein